MAELRRTGNDFALLFDEIEAKKLGLKEFQEYNLFKATNGIFVLVEKQTKKNELDEKLFDLIEQSDLSMRVEGTFEKMLEPEMRKRFNELVSQGLIQKFKLNQGYKKAVYKTKNELEQKPSLAQIKEVNKFEENIEDYSIEKNGYLVIKNELRAKKISEMLREEIQSGKVKGIKSFDSYYYIIQSQLYEELREKLVEKMKQKKEWSLESLVQETNLSKDLIKAVIEFLKDEGEAIEKRKEIYMLI